MHVGVGDVTDVCTASSGGALLLELGYVFMYSASQKL